MGNSDSRFPSGHFPEYLQFDLGVGLPTAHPIARALDDTGARLSDAAFADAYAVRPTLWDEETVREALTRIGFASECLNSAEAYVLYDRRDALLSRRGTLAALRELAFLYLGPSTVGRGSAVAAEPLPEGGARELVVADVPQQNASVFVRCDRDCDAERVAAFRRSAALLLPDNVRLRVLPPRREPTKARGGFFLGAPEKLSKRRL